MQRKEKDRGNIAAAEYKGDPEDMQICPQNAKTGNQASRGKHAKEEKSRIEDHHNTPRARRPVVVIQIGLPVCRGKKQRQNAAPASHKITAEGQ
jgi:hypothetical protein